MTRFNDEWLIDKTLFDYTMGGGCACCSFNFLPNGITGLIQDSMQSELETDAIQDEVNALDTIPWPNDLKDQVWMERVRLRQLLKKDMLKTYQPFFNLYRESYKEWLYGLQPKRLFQFFQLSRNELQNYWNKSSIYNIHAAFGTVLCGVIEQIANFHMTKYPIDGRGKLITDEHENKGDTNDRSSRSSKTIITGEIEFEKLLIFDKRCGFTLQNLLIDNKNKNSDDLTTKTTKQINKDVLDVWIIRHESLCGPKLLDRNYKTKTKTKSASSDDDNDDHDDNDNEEEGGDADDDNGDDADGQKPTTTTESKTTASFRADRRIVRLVIARIWANNLQSAYLKDMQKKEAEAAAATIK